ncbi:PAS domain-containing protein [Nitrospira sp. Nam74]
MLEPNFINAALKVYAMRYEEIRANQQSISQWRAELAALQTMSSPTFTPADEADLAFVLPACIDALSIEHMGPRQGSESANRPLELIRRGYVETDSNSLMTRINGAFQSLLNIPATFCGQTLILFIAKEDRRRFLQQFFRLRRREAFHLSHLNLRLQPYSGPPFLAKVSGQRIEGTYKQLLGIVWLMERIDEE